MKPDFLDELEQQLVEAIEHGRRARLRIWLARKLPGRSVILGIGGGAMALGTAAAILIVTGAGTRTAAPHAGPHSAASMSSRQLAAAPSGRYAPEFVAGSGMRRGSGGNAITIQGALSVDEAAFIPETSVTTEAVPHGFRPQSFTAASELTWWLLGTDRCGRRQCLAIVRTTDGGRRFVSIPAPPTTAVGQLRFASGQIGYAFGAQLWSTHDGGQRWRLVPTGGTVDELATAGGYVFALVRNGPRRWLMRSPIGLDSWSRVTVSGGEPFTGLWTQADEVLVETELPVSVRVGGRPRVLALPGLAISTDSGFRFRSVLRIPSAGACQINANLPVIWLHCPASAGGSTTWRSHNGGRSFAPAGGHRGGQLVSFQQIGASSSFAAASSRTAIDGTRQLYRTVDGGRRWVRVPTPRGIIRWQYLGFTDPTHGVALGLFPGGQERLYYTINGGRSYRYVPIDG